MSPYARRERAIQFESLRQSFDMTVTEYAKEFIRLSKYAPLIVPTESDRMEMFRHGLVGPIYMALATIDFPSLARIIDKAKQVEARFKVEKKFRKQRKKANTSGKGGFSK